MNAIILTGICIISVPIFILFLYFLCSVGSDADEHIQGE